MILYSLMVILVFFDEDFNKATFFANEIGILSVYPDTVIHVKLLAW